MSGAMQETTPAAAAAMTCLSLPLQTSPLAASASQCAAAAGCLFAVSLCRRSPTKYAQDVAVTASVFPPELALCFLCGGSSAQRRELAALAQAWG